MKYSKGTEALAERGYKEVDHLQYKRPTNKRGSKGKPVNETAGRQVP
jgi:hypothetical protein